MSNYLFKNGWTQAVITHKDALIASKDATIAQLQDLQVKLEAANKTR